MIAVPFGAHGISGTTQFDHQSRSLCDIAPANPPPSASRNAGSSDSCTSWRQKTSVLAARAARNAAIRARRKSASSSDMSIAGGYQTGAAQTGASTLKLTIESRASPRRRRGGSRPRPRDQRGEPGDACKRESSHRAHAPANGPRISNVIPAPSVPRCEFT